MPNLSLNLQWSPADQREHRCIPSSGAAHGPHGPHGAGLKMASCSTGPEASRPILPSASGPFNDLGLGCKIWSNIAHLWTTCNKLLGLLESVTALSCNHTVSENKVRRDWRLFFAASLQRVADSFGLSYWWYLVVTMVTVDTCSNMFKHFQTCSFMFKHWFLSLVYYRQSMSESRLPECISLQHSAH